VEVKVKLPGKAEQDLLALSGGEKAIVGLCLLFAFPKSTRHLSSCWTKWMRP